MGMFDELRCDYPLPDRPEWASDVFQTKDTDCFMLMHHITADGRLLLQEWKDGKRTEPEPTNWTGSMNIYTGRKDVSFSDQSWYEVVLLIRHGRVISADLVRLVDSQSAVDGETT